MPKFKLRMAITTRLIAITATVLGCYTTPRPATVSANEGCAAHADVEVERAAFSRAMQQLERTPRPSAFSTSMVLKDPAGGADAAISPDGRFVVLASHRCASWDLWVHEVATGKRWRITDHHGDDFEAQWSPDGTQLAFSSTRSGNKDIWVLSIATGTMLQVTDAADDEEYPAWSPDGKSLVYTGGPWRAAEGHGPPAPARDFFIVHADGSGRRRVTQESGWAGACSFWPDGQSLLCHRYDAGTGDVVRLSLDGSLLKTVTADAGWDYKPTASPPVPRWIAYSRALEGHSRIMMQPAAGGNARPLLGGSGDDRWPTWSADGTRLLFHRIVEEGTAVLRFDRTAGTTSTVLGPETAPLYASVDAQGKRLAYCATEGERQVIRVRDLETGTDRSLLDTSASACFPSWSPTGDRIAYVVKEGHRWQIETVTPAGNGRRSWTDSANLRGLFGPIDWSPDGTRIVFQSDTAPFAADLHILDTRDGTIRPLTHDGWFDESPAWTADGEGVIFMSTRGGEWTWGLFVIDIATGVVHEVVDHDWVEKNFPRMTVDGTVLYSSHDNNGVAWLTEKRPGMAPRHIAEAGAKVRWPSISADGQHVLFTTVDRRTEYWVVDNPLGEDSPIHTARPALQVHADSLGFVAPPTAVEREWAPIRRSPITLDHR